MVYPRFRFALFHISHFSTLAGPINAVACAPRTQASSPLCETWIPACAGSRDAGHAISCDRVILKGGRFGHARLGFDDNLAIILENSKIGKLFRFFLFMLSARVR